MQGQYIASVEAMAPGQRFQCLPGTDFQIQRRRLACDFEDAFREAHGVTQMAGVVSWIRGLGVGDPGTGQIGDIGDARRVQCYRVYRGGEFREDRVHHRGVERMRGVQSPDV